MNMMDEIEKNSSNNELSDDQKQKLSEAMSILNSLASECDCSIQELIEKGEEEEESHESEEEAPSEESPDSEGEDEDSGKNKVALMIAQLKSKKE